MKSADVGRKNIECRMMLEGTSQQTPATMPNMSPVFGEYAVAPTTRGEIHDMRRASRP